MKGVSQYFMWNFLSSKKNTKFVGLLTLLLLATAIPITLFLTHESQDTRQRAAEPCTMSLTTDTMIIFDKSGSMAQPTSATDSTPKLTRAKSGAKRYLDLLSESSVTPKHHIGVSSISSGDDGPKLESQLSEDYDAVRSAINGMSVQGATCIECAIKIANDEFKARGRTNIKKVGIIFSDGGATRYIGDNRQDSDLTLEERRIRNAEAQKRALAMAEKGKQEQGITFYTIAFGNGQDDNPLMIDIAEKTGGKFIWVPDASDLEEAFEEIAQQVGTGSIGGYKYYDEDEDGKYDTEEEKLAGWTITLKNSAGAVVDTQVTDSTGKYSFTGLCDDTYKVSEELQDGWKKVFPATEHTITVTNGSVHESTHFGNVFRGIPPTPTPPVCPENATLDAMIIFDKSGSMSDPTSTSDPTPRMTRAKAAATSFVDLLASDTKAAGEHHVGLSAFAAENTTTLDSPLTGDYIAVKTAINAMPIEAQTCVECGIKIANEEFRANARGGNVKQIAILITDGIATRYIGAEPPYDLNTQKLARQKALDEIKKGFAEQKITYYTIGFGNEVDKTFLQEAATATGGKYIQVPTAADLQTAFKQIADIAGVSTISGYKFLDTNSNAKFDTGEQKLPGWDIILKDADTDTEVASTVTDATGNYSFENVCIGNYTVSEIQKQGWLKTFPTNASHSLKVTKGQPFPNINFGNKEAPTPNTFSISLLLDGIGVAGDTQNPRESEFSNKNPLRPTREVTVEVINDANKIIDTTTGSTTYDLATGRFIGEANIDIDFPADSYFLRFKVPNYLSKKTTEKVEISRTEDNIIPPLTLITGDTNNDNKINMLDYNNILTCYTGLKGTPKSCTDTQRSSADTNDDGKVNEVDYNLFIRELPAIAGT